ncbi:MAG TPA: adenylate/guanylate cyclase domain-containing protein [Acidimicrobiales bacterium]|jgi:class 3 adenylate cyclase
MIRDQQELTFLFTDIVDSTRLWDRVPDRMAVALARHDALVRAAITSHQGEVFAAEGDGVAAVFTSASAATAAAVEAQRAVGREAWPSEAVIRVRMGLHTGGAIVRDGNYYGPVVNRASRISASGHGNQILVSAATAERVADDGWSLVDLGRYRLHGLDCPERVYRLDADGLPVTDLPLRAGGERPGGPVDPTVVIIVLPGELLIDAVCPSRRW